MSANRLAYRIACINNGLVIVAMGLHLGGPLMYMLINFYSGTIDSELKMMPFTGMYLTVDWL